MGFSLKRTMRKARRVFKEKLFDPIAHAVGDTASGAGSSVKGGLTKGGDWNRKGAGTKLWGGVKGGTTFGVSSQVEAHKDSEDLAEQQHNAEMDDLMAPERAAEAKRKAAENKQRDNVLSKRQGRQSTVLGGGTVKDNSNLAKSKLLGK